MWEVIDGKRTEILAFVGMSAPAGYDVFMKQWANQQVVPEYRELFERKTSRAYLLDCFQPGYAENSFELRALEEILY